MDALLLPVGREWHALDLAVVREIVKAPVVAPVPQGPRWLLGLVNLRGEIVPVIDTGGPLDVAAHGAPTHLTIADTSFGVAAVAASGAPRPGTLGEQAGPGNGGGAAGQYDAGDVVVTLVDLDALVALE